MKNIVYIGRSLDGYIADGNGGLDWLNIIPNPAGEDMGYHAHMERVDALIMGRSTYDVVANFGGDWPYEKHVFVLSNSLKKVPTHLNEKVTILSGSIPDILKEVHAQGFQTLYIDGGQTIQSFLKLDLIDEMILTTIPILLGGGFSLFGELEKPLRFDHRSSKVFLDQVVQDHYVRLRE